MDYKYIYNTNFILELKNDSEETKGDVKIFELLSNYIKNNIDKLNKTLNSYGIEFSKSENNLDNDNNVYLVIKSTDELTISSGLNTLAIGFNNSNNIILLTFEPIKLIYNSYIKELNQRLINYIKTDYSYFYIVLVNKLEPIKDEKLLDDLQTVRELSENIQRYNDIKEALINLIKIMKLEEEIKNRDLIIKGLQDVILIYNKMVKDYKELRDLRIEIDIHTGNWKYGISNKGKKLIAIDPFVIFYGKLKYEIDLFNKLGKAFINNNKN